jgi:hypothetical protein
LTVINIIFLFIYKITMHYKFKTTAL